MWILVIWGRQGPGHQQTMMTSIFPVVQPLFEGNPPVTGGFPSQRPVARSFDVFFDLRLNKRLSKPSNRQWFETQSRCLWCHCHDLGLPYNGAWLYVISWTLVIWRRQEPGHKQNLYLLRMTVCKILGGCCIIPMKNHLKCNAMQNIAKHFFINGNTFENVVCENVGHFVRMMTSSNGNIFRVTGHLCGKFTGPRWISRTKASDAELWCPFDMRPNIRLSKQSWGWWFETPPQSLWRHRNGVEMSWSSAAYSSNHDGHIYESPIPVTLEVKGGYTYYSGSEKNPDQKMSDHVESIQRKGLAIRIKHVILDRMMDLQFMCHLLIVK